MLLEDTAQTLLARETLADCFSDLENVTITETFDDLGEILVVSFKHGSTTVSLKFRLNENNTYEYLVGLENEKVVPDLGRELSDSGELSSAAIKTWVEKKFLHSVVQEDVRDTSETITILPGNGATDAEVVARLNQALSTGGAYRGVDINRVLPPTLPSSVSVSNNPNLGPQSTSTVTVAPSVVSPSSSEELRTNWGCPLAFLASATFVVLTVLAIKNVMFSDKHSTVPVRSSHSREWRTTLQSVPARLQTPLLTLAHTLPLQPTPQFISVLNRHAYRISTIPSFQPKVGDAITLISCDGVRTGDGFYRTAGHLVVYSFPFNQASPEIK